MKTYIRYVVTQWVLTIESADQVVYAKPCRRLIEAIDTACSLQLHVDNLNELPLNQYQGGIVCTLNQSSRR